MYDLVLAGKTCKAGTSQALSCEEAPIPHVSTSSHKITSKIK